MKRPQLAAALAALLACLIATAPSVLADDADKDGRSNKKSPAKASAKKSVAKKSATKKPAPKKPAAEKSSAKKSADARYQIRYKFQKGETIRTRVLHVASTETRIRGNKQTAKSRSLSIKEWRIVEVSPEGLITLDQLVQRVDMAKQQSGRPEVTYNSQKDKNAPPDYREAAKSVGKVIARLVIKPDGEIVERKKGKATINLGMGPMVIPLPTKPAPLGHSWYFPTNIAVTMQDGVTRRIKTREKYTLKKVANGVATIRVVSQVLTPVKDPRIQAQLMQQLNNGEIKFDIDAGRMISQQMDWDEKVVGFSGGDSIMEYLARFEEKLHTESASEDEKNAVPVKKTARRSPADKPRLRRR